MSAVDFGEWAAPELELTFGGRTYTVPPPSVEDAKKILALAVLGELELGLLKGEMPAAVQQVIDSIRPDEHPALGDAYQAMLLNKVPQPTIDRMRYYAVFFWARGREYADSLAKILWTPRDPGGERGDAAPKG